jgi:hypothetical protein
LSVSALPESCTPVVFKTKMPPAVRVAVTPATRALGVRSLVTGCTQRPPHRRLTRWKDHDAYSKGLERLLRDLKVAAEPPT